MKRLYLLLFYLTFSIISVAQFRSTSMYLDKEVDRTTMIGYTTNYGYGFNRQVSYTSTYNPSQSQSPRKSPQRPYSGGTLEDFIDWLRMNTDSNWPSYVDDDYWEQFLEDHPEYKDEAEEWFEEHGQTPPWAVPISDGVLFLCVLVMIYFMIRLRICKVIGRTL